MINKEEKPKRDTLLFIVFRLVVSIIMVGILSFFSNDFMCSIRIIVPIIIYFILSFIPAFLIKLEYKRYIIAELLYALAIFVLLNVFSIIQSLIEYNLIRSYDTDMSFLASIFIMLPILFFVLPLNFGADIICNILVNYIKKDKNSNT